jgi:predicted nucleic acid-binding protein
MADYHTSATIARLDLMHAEAAIKYGADELLTLDNSGFATLNLSLQVAAP